MNIVINGASSADELPGFETFELDADFVFAPDEATLGRVLPQAEVVLGWNFRGQDLRNCWQFAESLRWIHWCGAGVDAVLFPELVESDVMLTNARGIFDRPMAEYVLGYMLHAVKDFEGSRLAQQEKRWDYRMTGKLAGQSAAVFGVGSIGREVVRLLRAVDVSVVGVGRSERDDPELGRIRSVSDALEIASAVDWVIGVMPSTHASDGLFDGGFFAAMPEHARFINIGRGRAQDEAALCAALGSGQIAGALIDVFHREPLPDDSLLWNAPNLFLSPHMSGDYPAYLADMVTLFFDNLARYFRSEPLRNVVDKRLGFVAC